MLDHPAVLESGYVDDIDADRLARRRMTKLPGAVVGAAGTDPQPYLVAHLRRVLERVVQVRDAGPQSLYEPLELGSGHDATGAAVRGELVLDDLRRDEL